MIRPGISGELPTTDDEWIKAVRNLADNPAKRGLMGLAARESVETNYSVRAWEGAFVAALAGATTAPPPSLKRSAQTQHTALIGKIASGQDGHDRIFG